VLYSESVERHTGEEALADSLGPIFVNLLSKTQVDRLGDRLRKGIVAEEDIQQLDAYRRSFAESYDEIVAVVRDATQLEPTGRPAKSTTSIIEKLRRETIRLSQMQDIAGCRVVVPDMQVQDQVVERMKIALPKADVVDRRKQPSFGYRAVHIIATDRNKMVEVQVRTELQHFWAQSSEKLSDSLGAAIKYGGGDPIAQRMLSHWSRLLAVVEDVELHPSAPGLTPNFFSEARHAFREYLGSQIEIIVASRRKSKGDL
jgi:ppGpp synthetase/RelA/SpoT-type nucleotidyltranferase